MNRYLMVTVIILSILIIAICLSGCLANPVDEALNQAEAELLAAESYALDITTDNLEDALYEKVKKEILSWDEEEIYAISFFVYSNEAFEYNGIENVSMWSISFNTEKDCDDADAYAEERWNYAFWRQDEFPVIDIYNKNKYTDVLFDWYEEQGVTEIGFEDEDKAYDEASNYIGKGPNGHYELLSMAADIGRKLQEEGLIKEHFGQQVPIIVHGLEYAWFDIEATTKANPNGEADVFLKAIKTLEFY